MCVLIVDSMYTVDIDTLCVFSSFIACTLGAYIVCVLIVDSTYTVVTHCDIVCVLIDDRMYTVVIHCVCSHR